MSAAATRAAATVAAGLRWSMQCNIDARGKAARLKAGLVAVVLGAILLGLALAAGVGPGWLAWVGLGLVAAGGFGIFEARAGWCAVRAMGIRTPL